jgi:hypothetical protein
MTDATDAAVLPGLAQVADRLPALAVPDDPIDPAGSFEQTYSILAADSGSVCGHLGLRRVATADGATMAADWSKGAGNASHWHVAARIDSRRDPLGTTRRWHGEAARRSSRFDAPGQPIAGTGAAFAGEVEGGEIRLRATGTAAPERIPATEEVTFDWQLFDVVQRLPRGTVALGPFTIVDGLGAVRRGQRLAYRGAERVGVAGGVRRLHGYDLVGPGTVPWTYWVDERTSRLLAAVSGLEGYVLGRLPPGGGRERPGKAGRKAAAAEAAPY